MHNAGVYAGQAGRRGEEGVPTLFGVNVLAPYILTCGVAARPPGRHVYVSSGLHRGGGFDGGDIAAGGYGNTKLQVVMFAKAVARRWTGCLSNAVDPGWVPTKMGGPTATDDLDKAVDTYVMLAVGKGVPGDFIVGIGEDKWGQVEGVKAEWVDG